MLHEFPVRIHPLRFSITSLSLSDHRPLVDTMSKRASESEGGSAIWPCRTLHPVVFTHSSQDVRAAVNYGDCNEVDEVDRLQLDGAAAGTALPDLRRRCS